MDVSDKLGVVVEYVICSNVTGLLISSRPSNSLNGFQGVSPLDPESKLGCQILGLQDTNGHKMSRPPHYFTPNNKNTTGVNVGVQYQSGLPL